MNKFLIVGGCNIDYIGVSNEKISKSASNIGSISSSFGGVGRNIAENLLNLGNKVSMITALGEDFGGKSLKNYMENMGCQFIIPSTNKPTGSYMVINSNDHDIVAGICDNRIIEDISPLFIAQNQKVFDEFVYLGIDANLTQLTIDYLFKNFKDKKIFVDAISPAKAVKFINYLSDIYLLKCNRKEALSILKEEMDVSLAAEKLLRLGVKNIVISNGPKDIVYGNKKEGIKKCKVKKAKEFKNTTGCGDALTSGTIFKLANGCSLEEAVTFGEEIAYLTLFSETSTSSEVSRKR